MCYFVSIHISQPGEKGQDVRVKKKKKFQTCYRYKSLDLPWSYIYELQKSTQHLYSWKQYDSGFLGGFYLMKEHARSLGVNTVTNLILIGT